MDDSSAVKTMSRFVVAMGDNEYVMQGGGGLQPGVPIPPDTVDSAAIIDGAVQMQDLSPEIVAGDDDIDSIFDQQ